RTTFIGVPAERDKRRMLGKQLLRQGDRGLSSFPGKCCFIIHERYRGWLGWQGCEARGWRSGRAAGCGCDNDAKRLIFGDPLVLNGLDAQGQLIFTGGKFVLCHNDPGARFVGRCRGQYLAIRLHADIGVWRCLSSEYRRPLRVDPHHVETRKRFVAFFRFDGCRLGPPRAGWFIDLRRLLESRRALTQDNVNEIGADHDRAGYSQSSDEYESDPVHQALPYNEQTRRRRKGTNQLLLLNV